MDKKEPKEWARQVDIHPTAAASYARTLIERGCPPRLATLTAEVIARLDGNAPTPEEQTLISRAYAHLDHESSGNSEVR